MWLWSFSSFLLWRSIWFTNTWYQSLVQLNKGVYVNLFY